MKISFFTIAFIPLFLTHTVLAMDQCSVLGFHQPGTQTYDGPTWCEQVNIKNIIVRGPLQIMQSVMTGSPNVSGPITSSDSRCSSITEENNLTKEIITLKNASIVSGNIIFKGVFGSVVLSQDSKILGRVINGKITVC